MKKIVIRKKGKVLIIALSVVCVVLISFLLQALLSNNNNESSAMSLDKVIEQQLMGKPIEPTDQKEKTELNNKSVNKDHPVKAQGEQQTPESQPKTVQQDSDTKVAYVTFDDGPSRSTERLLDILAEHGAKATFFMLQPNMQKFPDSVTRTVHDGHAAALHGVSHSKQLFYKSTESVLYEMDTAQATVLEITGYKPTLIRTPYGSQPDMKPTYKEAVKQAGYQLWDWNVDSRDWYYRDHRMVSNTIGQIKKLAENNITPVILLHDRAETVGFVPEILEYLINNGYQLKPLDDTMEPVVF